MNDPSEEFQLDAAAFLEWRGSITEQALRSDAVVNQLYTTAVTSAKQAAEKAAVAATAAFDSWIKERPSAGLKLQHRLSRNASGWIPSAFPVPVPPEGEEPDGTDGLSKDELRQVRGGPADCLTPLSMQQAAEAERERWGKEWAADAERIEPDWSLIDLRTLPEPLLIREFQDACATFPTASGLGWGAVHPRALLRLSPFLLQKRS